MTHKKNLSSLVVFGFIGAWGGATLLLLIIFTPKDRVTLGYLVERKNQLERSWPLLPDSEKEKKLKKFVQAYANFLRTHPSKDDKNQARLVLAVFFEKIKRLEDAIFWYNQYGRESLDPQDSFIGFSKAISLMHRTAIPNEKKLEVLSECLKRFPDGEYNLYFRLLISEIHLRDANLQALFCETGAILIEAIRLCLKSSIIRTQ